MLNKLQIIRFLINIYTYHASNWMFFLKTSNLHVTHIYPCVDVYPHVNFK